MRLCVLLVVAALSQACVKPGPALTAGPAGSQRTPRPLELSLPLLGGGTYSLAGDRGKVVLLDVWATWCDPCRDSLPLYEDLKREYGPRGFEVYALNVDTDARMVTAFVEREKLGLPVLLDPGAAWAESKLKVRMMPTAFLIDRKGVPRITHEGFDEALLSSWVQDIESLLAEAP